MAIEGEGPERGKSLKKSEKKRHHLYCRGVGEYWGTFRVRHAFYCLGTRKQRSFDLIALKLDAPGLSGYCFGGNMCFPMSEVGEF